MKKNILFIGFVLLIQNVYAQTATRVYNIIQANCVSCHGGASPSGGLKLDGSQSSLMTTLINGIPNNTAAKNAGMKYVYPGRPDKSFLFHKVNQDLDPYYTLSAGMGGSMPQGGQMTKPEREMIRQWIMYGAKTTGTQVEEQLITDYYNVPGKGLPSFPNGAPAAPPAGQGFQLKMGPFFLAPNATGTGYTSPSEVEYYQKYELSLPANIETNRISTLISGSSHHFIMYKFDNATAAGNIQHGLRTAANHSNINLVYAIQEQMDLKLPNKTAFKWAATDILDFDSHYINYSGTQILAAEVYINVHTQPLGTALHEMNSLLIPNTNIPIPNDANNHTFTQNIAFQGVGNVYVWGIMGHTHKYGKDYNAYLRNANGTRGAKIYDAECFEGNPATCVSPNFDYQHVPMRYFYPLFPINMTNGFIHEAIYNNDGPSPVNFGPTSNDEMMVIIAMYTTDTTGMNMPPNIGVSSVKNETLQGSQIIPNPMTQTATVVLPPTADKRSWTFILTDIAGRIVRNVQINDSNQYTFDKKEMSQGLYFYTILKDSGESISGKLMVE